jgi:hypothetical protein
MTVELDGPMQAQVRQLVDETGAIAGLKPRYLRDIRAGYSPNAPTSFYEILDDGQPALVLHSRVLNEFREPATKQLVTLHEIYHRVDIDRWGLEYCRRLETTQRIAYEIDLEKRAFETLQQHYARLGQRLPQETLQVHDEVMRILSGRK